jgi:hypothetical protein
MAALLPLALLGLSLRHSPTAGARGGAHRAPPLIGQCDRQPAEPFGPRHGLTRGSRPWSQRCSRSRRRHPRMSSIPLKNSVTSWRDGRRSRNSPSHSSDWASALPSGLPRGCRSSKPQTRHACSTAAHSSTLDVRSDNICLRGGQAMLGQSDRRIRSPVRPSALVHGRLVHPRVQATPMRQLATSSRSISSSTRRQCRHLLALSGAREALLMEANGRFAAALLAGQCSPRSHLWPWSGSAMRSSRLPGSSVGADSSGPARSWSSAPGR